MKEHEMVNWSTEHSVQRSITYYLLHLLHIFCDGWRYTHL